MTSKFSSENMPTMKGKITQKTIGFNTKSKGNNSTSNNNEYMNRKEAAKAYNDRLPKPLFEKSQSSEAELRNKENKEQLSMQTSNQANSLVNNQPSKSSVPEDISKSSKPKDTTEIKEYSYDNESNDANEEDKKGDKVKESMKKMLEQVIYITISEIPTQIMYYVPSTKALKLKNDKEIEEVEKRIKNYAEYEQKMKNKESFAKKGMQTISKFKSFQVVTTNATKDADTSTDNSKRVSCLNYNISDMLQEKRQKNEDYCATVQKVLERSARKQYKQRFKENKDNLNEDAIDISIRSVQHSGYDESTSFYEGITQNSMQSSRRPNVNKDKTEIKKSSLSSSMMNKSSMSETERLKEIENLKVMQHVVQRRLNDPLPKTLAYPLKFVERLLSQNTFHFQQISYKDYPVNIKEFENHNKKKTNAFAIPSEKGEEELRDEKRKEEIKRLFDNENPEKIKLINLFTYPGDSFLKTYDITTKYICHCLDWNTYNRDLLAAVYGDPDINSKSHGFLCFWTLKKPMHPEKVIKTPRGLTYCNFSRRNPYLIVCSDYQGEIMIFDLRNESNTPIADSSEVKDKHTDIVWECKWIERLNDKNEIIISTSSDGKVKEWSLKKGLEVVDLLKMKKSTSFPKKDLNPFVWYKSSKAGGAKDTLIFREANGLSFDFPRDDSTVYYIALEECTIHRCRIGYKDQYTDNYYGHQGPVNKIRCNPFDPNILISCSYDWTIKIWNNKNSYPVMNLHSDELTNQVNDIEWSDDTSTVFGCVTDDGRIEIWDLARNPVQPIITDGKGMASKKSIKFCFGGKVVAVGDVNGNITIYKLCNLDHKPVSQNAQIEHLNKVLIHNSEINDYKENE